MAESKKKTEDELDAVSAAYESISAKLEDLRKKQAALENQTEDDQDDNLTIASKESESLEQEDDEAIEEFDAEEETTVSFRHKTHKKEEASFEEDLDVPAPLPGTEEKSILPKKQIYQANDPLDDESVEEFEDQDLADIGNQSMTKKQEADEMQKWENLNQEDTLSGTDFKEQPEESEVAVKPTFTPISQDEFQARLRRPRTSDEAEENLPRKTQQIESDEVNTLDDLAEETIEPKGNEGTMTNINRPTSTESFEDDWDIRRLRPQHSSPFSRDEDRDIDTPPANFRRPAQEDNYFDRRNQPLPRKKASIWHLLVLLLIGASVIGATFYFLKYQFSEQTAPTPSPEIATPTPTPTPIPTPVSTISDRSAFTVRVLNGTSQTGLAGTILTKLKNAGFKTDRSGNATNSAFKQTIIRVKEGTQSAILIDTVTKDLGSEFNPISETTLKSSDRADIEVILGIK